MYGCIAGSFGTYIYLEKLCYSLGEHCSSDLQCTKTLLGTNMITKENHREVLISLSNCIDGFLYDQIKQVGSEQNFRSECYKVIKHSHIWATPQVLSDLKRDRVFGQSMASLDVLKSKVQAKNSFEISNIQLVPEYRLIEVLMDLFDIYEKNKNNKDKKWFAAASNLICACTGTRFIESCVASTFEMSKTSEFPSDTNIVVKGLSKKGKAAKKKYSKLLASAREDNDDNRIKELEQFSDNDVLDLVTDVVMTRPILTYGISKISTQFLVDLN